MNGVPCFMRGRRENEQKMEGVEDFSSPQPNVILSLCFRIRLHCRLETDLFFSSFIRLPWSGTGCIRSSVMGLQHWRGEMGLSGNSIGARYRSALGLE